VDVGLVSFYQFPVVCRSIHSHNCLSLILSLLFPCLLKTYENVINPLYKLSLWHFQTFQFMIPCLAHNKLWVLERRYQPHRCKWPSVSSAWTMSGLSGPLHFLSLSLSADLLPLGASKQEVDSVKRDWLILWSIDDCLYHSIQEGWPLVTPLWAIRLRAQTCVHLRLLITVKGPGFGS
jgi:hypothetical protein